MNEWMPAITAVTAITVALLSGGLTALLLWRSNRKKVEAEAADILTGAALDIVKALRTRIDMLESESEQTRKRIAKLERRVEVLEGEVECLQEQKRGLELGNAALSDQLESEGLVPLWQGVP